MSQLTDIESNPNMSEEEQRSQPIQNYIVPGNSTEVRRQQPKFGNIQNINKDSGFFKLPTFSLVTLGFAFIYFAIVYVCYSLVSGGSAGINMVVPVALSFFVAFEIQYVVMLRNNRHFDNKEWNLDKVIWNCFVVLMITSATGITIFFMMLKSKNLYFFDDFVNKFNAAQLSFFIIMICFYFFLCAMVIWHIIIHRRRVLKL